MEKYYDENSRDLTLVKEIKDGEIVTETFSFPIFVEGIYTQKAIELGAELEENEFMINADMFQRISNFIVGLYGKQFSRDQLVKGIDTRHNISTYIAVLFGVLNGDSKNE